jgi:serine/threonine protein kinase
MSSGTPHRPPVPADATTPQPAPPAGSDLAGRELGGGRFFIESELGRGTFAVVHKGWDRERDAPCAIKIQQGTIDRMLRDRFRGEIDALIRLRHPAILPLHAAGELDGRGYMVVDLARGGSLLDHVRKNGLLECEPAAEVGMSILGALAAAHAAGIVHRDVKPGNVLLDPGGGVLLADFGSALNMAADIDRHTATGDALGTFLYMAPEQRADARRAGPPADLYALATMLVRVTTPGKPRDLFMAAAGDARWDAVPAPLRALCIHATRLDPLARPRDAADMAERLLAALDPAHADRLRARPGLDPRTWPPPAQHLRAPAGPNEEATTGPVETVPPLPPVQTAPAPPAPAPVDPGGEGQGMLLVALGITGLALAGAAAAFFLS